MPGCSAIGCSNRSEQGFRMFLIPQGVRNEERRNQWISNIGRPGLPLKSVVCEAHFTSDQFENRRQDNKRFLKWNAVPTIFNKFTDVFNKRKCKERGLRTNKKGGKNHQVCHAMNCEIRKSLRKVKPKILNDFYNDQDLNDEFVLNLTDLSKTSVISNEITNHKKNLCNLNNNRNTVCSSELKKSAEIIPEEHIRIEYRLPTSDDNKNLVSKNIVCVSIGNICRICGKLSETLLPIFSNEAVKKRVPLLIMQYLPIKVRENDQHQPLNACDACIKCLIDWDFLINKCNEVEKMFIQMLERSKVISQASKKNSTPLNNEKTYDDSIDNVECINRNSYHSSESITETCDSEKISDNELIQQCINNEIIVQGALNDHNYCPLDKNLPKIIPVRSLTKESVNGIDNCNSDDRGEYHNSFQIAASTVDAAGSEKIKNNKCQNKITVKENERVGNERSSFLAKNGSSEVLIDIPVEVASIGDTDDETSNDIGDNDDVNGNNNDSSVVVQCDRSTKLSLEKQAFEKTLSYGKQSQEYKIGITIERHKELDGEDRGGELDFNSLKSILIKKVNCLFQSICNDEIIGKSLVKTSNQVLKNVCSKEDSGMNEIFDGVGVCNIRSNNNNFISNNNKETATGNNEILHNTDRADGSDTMVINERCNSNVLPKLDHLKVKKRKLLKMSLIRTENGPGFLCSDCGHLLNKRKSFEQHRRIHHTEKKCEYCDLTLVSFFDYRRHIRESHKDIVYTVCCELCSAKFIKSERLQRHKLIVHNIGEYFYCDVCGKKCASKQQLHCHKSDKHHSDKNLCPYCGENFVSHNSYKSHVRSKHGSRKVYPCTICQRELKTLNSLIIHTARHSNVKPGDNREGDYLAANALLKTMVSNKKYSCLVCNVKLGGADLLKQHMRYHTEDDSIKSLSGTDRGKWICCLCNKYLEKEKDLALHRFYFHDEIPFFCRVNNCASSFWSKYEAVVHNVSTHRTKASSITCSMCSETFKTYRKKQWHVRRHHLKLKPNHSLTVKSLRCGYCNKNFSSEATLKMHMVVHSDVKEYCCHLCDKSFKLKLTLSKHLRFHMRNMTVSHMRNMSEEENRGDSENIEVRAVSAPKMTDLTLMPQSNTEFMLVESKRENEDVSFRNQEVGLSAVVDGGEILQICTVFKCSDCDKLFLNKIVLEDHIMHVHNTGINKGAFQFELNDVFSLAVEDNVDANEFL